MSGFIDPAKEAQEFTRITYLESQLEKELTPEEVAEDEKRKDEELEHMGTIGFKNPNEITLKYKDAIA